MMFCEMVAGIFGFQFCIVDLDDIALDVPMAYSCCWSGLVCVEVEVMR